MDAKEQNQSSSEGMDFTAKVFLSLCTVAIAGIPSWIILSTKHLLEAEGFWQNFAVLVVGIFFLGTLQIIFLGFGLGVMIAIWISKKPETEGKEEEET